MNTLVVVNNVDITPYMDWKSYKVAPKEDYEKWQDGNYVEHRIYTRSRLQGSFNVWLCGMNDMDTDAFMELWNGAVHNHVVTLGVYDQTQNRMRAIEAYYEITPSKHREMVNGNYFDIFKIEVYEK